MIRANLLLWIMVTPSANSSQRKHVSSGKGVGNQVILDGLGDRFGLYRRPTPGHASLLNNWIQWWNQRRGRLWSPDSLSCDCYTPFSQTTIISAVDHDFQLSPETPSTQFCFVSHVDRLCLSNKTGQLDILQSPTWTLESIPLGLQASQIILSDRQQKDRYDTLVIPGSILTKNKWMGFGAEKQRCQRQPIRPSRESNRSQRKKVYEKTHPGLTPTWRPNIDQRRSVGGGLSKS